jgi:hypothetical protein
MADRPPSSLRGCLNRYLDPERRSLLKRMVRKIDLGEHWHFGGSHRSCQRLFMTTFWIVDRRKVNPVTVGADYLRRVVKACIELLRIARLCEIEPLGADLKRDCYRVITSRNGAGEERANKRGGSEKRPGAHEYCPGVHLKLLKLR